MLKHFGCDNPSLLKWLCSLIRNDLVLSFHGIYAHSSSKAVAIGGEEQKYQNALIVNVNNSKSSLKSCNKKEQAHTARKMQ